MTSPAPIFGSPIPDDGVIKYHCDWAGHQDGILSFGRTVAAAAKVILALLPVQ